MTDMDWLMYANIAVWIGLGAYLAFLLRNQIYKVFYVASIMVGSDRLLLNRDCHRALLKAFRRRHRIRSIHIQVKS